MSWLTNMSIGRRLTAAFALSALLTLIVGGIALVSLRSVAGSYSTLLSTRVANQTDALTLQGAAARERASFGNYILTGKREHAAAMSEAAAEVAAGLKALRGRVSGEEAGRVTAIANAYEHFAATVSSARAAYERGDSALAKRIADGQVVPAGDKLRGVVTPFVTTEEAATASADRSAASSANAAQVLAGVVLALALAAAAALAVLISRSIVRPLRTVEEATGRAAEGDLTTMIGSESRDELGQVARAFDRMVGALRELVSGIAEAARDQSRIATEMADASGQAGQAVGEVAATVEQVARGSEDQSQATQRASETIGDMVTGVRQVAEGGQTTAQLAERAEQTARAGAETVDAATDAMARIGESVAGAASVVDALGERSRAVGEIVETISDIAAQTNLLALNAAIEAARAGEQGRGFAVVAEEVRKLAEGVEHQASSIADIIGDIQLETGRAVEAMGASRGEVDDGSVRVSAAGEAFQTIHEQVTSLAGEIGGMAAAAQQLEAGAELVQEQIASVAAVSEENAAAAQQVAASTEETSASTEEIAATSRHVAETAGRLSEMVARFRV